MLLNSIEFSHLYVNMYVSSVHTQYVLIIVLNILNNKDNFYSVSFNVTISLYLYYISRTYLISGNLYLLSTFSHFDHPHTHLVAATLLFSVSVVLFFFPLVREIIWYLSLGNQTQLLSLI